MAQKMDIQKKKCITPEFRASFPHLFKPKAFKQGQEPKFMLTMLFTKKQDLKELKRAAHNAAVEKWGPKENWPAKMKMPFRDGNEKSDLEGYADMITVTATSKTQPGVVSQDLSPILSEQQFYAGCYARAELIAFPYDESGNVGVSFALQNVQKLRDGKPFSGRKRAEDVFEAVEDDSNNPDSYADTDEEYSDNAGF